KIKKKLLKFRDKILKHLAINNNLKFIREEIKMTQQEFADFLNIPLSSYTRFEYDKSDLPLRAIKKIIASFPQINVNMFFTGTKQETNAQITISANNNLREAVHLLDNYANKIFLDDLIHRLRKIKEASEF
ncbi:helix-turn-helix transcriptional regulator, partial [Campylobacter upsaliensis]|nr:helix-turn-helix transcriptional regulator [Campylobacter upsaliensis]